jgi:hypothetical protein
MRRPWRTFGSRLCKLKLTDLLTLANLAKAVIEIVRSLAGDS